MNKIIQAKLKQAPKKQFLFYYPYITLEQQLNIGQKKISRKGRNSKSQKRKSTQKIKKYGPSQLKQKKKQEFMQYLSTKPISSIPISRLANKSPQKDHQVIPDNFQRQSKIRSRSALCRSAKAIPQVQKINIIQEAQLMVHTETFIPHKEQTCQIPGVRFKGNRHNNSQTKQIHQQDFHAYSSQYEIQKMINIESIIQRNCKNFTQLMLQFYKRSNISSGSMIFVFNSQDTWFKKVLIQRGWMENLNKDSRAYHLSWSYKYPSNQPFSSQIVNHYQFSDAVTSKYRLHEALSAYHCLELQPPTYDLTRQKHQFGKHFSKNYFCYIMAQFLNIFQFDYMSQNDSCTEIQEHSRQIIKSLQMDKTDGIDAIFLKLLRGSLRMICGEQYQKQHITLQNIKHQIDRIQKLSIQQQNIVRLIKRLYSQIPTSEQCKNIWILKSRAGSKGAGIILSNNIAQIYKNQTRLIQKYIQNPLLLAKINRHKFDIRLWVLVTGFKKIKVHYYEQFYGRLCSEPYELSEISIKNQFKHLTNYSINKSKYTEMDGRQQSIIFSQNVFQQIQKEYGFDYKDRFFKDLQSMLRKLRPIFQNQVCKAISCKSFQLFGFDLLIDSKFCLHLLEINLSAKCEQRHHKLSQMLTNMGSGLLNIIQKKSDKKGWRLLL